MKKYLEEDGKMFVDGKEVKFVEDPVIYVPDEIEFEKYPDTLGMRFEKDRSLYFYDGAIRVDKFFDSEKVKCKLTPCEWEDLKVGDWGFRSDSIKNDFSEKYWYFLKTDVSTYRYINLTQEICLSSLSHLNWNYYWKVERV